MIIAKLAREMLYNCSFFFWKKYYKGLSDEKIGYNLESKISQSTENSY